MQQEQSRSEADGGELDKLHPAQAQIELLDLPSPQPSPAGRGGANEQSVPVPGVESPTSELDKRLSLRYESSAEIVDVDEPTSKLVIFDLQGERFAFPGESIREILPQNTADVSRNKPGLWHEIFFVPGCPPSVEGVINVRGDIESVIRLSELLGKPTDAQPAQTSSILIAQGGGMRSGIRVDRIVDVLDVAQSEIHAPPTTLSDAMRRIVSGVTLYQAAPVVVLDLNRLFEDYIRGLV